MNAGDEVDQRGLAGAVRPDQADDLALSTVELDVVDGAFRPPNRRDTLLELRSAVIAATLPPTVADGDSDENAVRHEQDQHAR